MTQPVETRQPEGQSTTQSSAQRYMCRIAATLNQVFSAYEVVAKVGMRQRDSLLYVAFESIQHEGAQDSTAVDARSLLPVLQKTLRDLDLGWLKLAKVSGRLPGQREPLWQHELVFDSGTPVPEIAKTLMNPAPVSRTGDVNVHIGGNLSGQIIIGNNNQQTYTQYTYNVAHGGVLNVAAAPTIALRPSPVALQPRPFPNLLDRRTLLPEITAALRAQQPVEVYAKEGFGKTALMRHLAYDSQLVSAPAAAAEDPFPDGVVYLSAHRQLASELLQSLYDAFYDTNPPLVPSYGQVQQSLHDKRALIILNNLALEKASLDWLIAALPACTFVLVSQERLYWQEGMAIALPGLPLPESIALIQMDLGRALTAAEQGLVETVWTALEGNPLQLRRVAAQLKNEDTSLVAWVQSLPGQAISRQSIFQRAVGRLSASQKSVLALMGAMGGVALSAEQSLAIAQVPMALSGSASNALGGNAGSPLSELADLHLVEATVETTAEGTAEAIVGSAIEGGAIEGVAEGALQAYQLSADLVPLVQQAFDPMPWMTRAVDYFMAQGTLTPAAQLASSQLNGVDAMTYLLDWTQRTGQWTEILALTKRLDPLLSLGGRSLGGGWEQWQQVLEAHLQAAGQLRNLPAQAWALHQLGTRSLAIGEVTQAATRLSQALGLRMQLGDRAGAAVTRHNLGLIPMPVSTGEGATPFTLVSAATPRPFRWVWPVIGGLLTAGVLGAVGAWYWVLRPQDSSAQVGQVRLSDTDITFGARALGSASAPKGVTLSNEGTTALQLSQIVLSGEGDFELAEAGECQIEQLLVPGEDCELSVIFTPTTVGEHDAGVSVVVNSVSEADGSYVPSKSPAITLTGVGTPQPVPSLSFNSAGLTFGETVLGESKRKTLKISNDGSAPLVVEAVSVERRKVWPQQPANDFTIESNSCAGGLAPGASCTVGMQFSPTAEGATTARLMVKSNVDDDSVVELRGTGVTSRTTGDLLSGLPGGDSEGAGETDTPVTGSEAADSGSDSAETNSAETNESETNESETGSGLQAVDDEIVMSTADTVVPVYVLSNDLAPSQDPLTISAVGSATLGEVEIVGDAINYRPSGEAGRDRFTYEITDSLGTVSKATVSVTIEAVADPDANHSTNPDPVDDPADNSVDEPVESVPEPNSAPVAANYDLTLQFGEALTLNLVADAYDPNASDVLSIAEIANLEVGGRLQNNGDGTVTYLHWDGVQPGQVGSYNNSFEYTISDGQGGEGRGVVSITVIIPEPVQ
ncbi:MAG: choice-of-anchor D domain-containing protein [Cyanobacteria bacterium J06560_5]